MYYLHMHFNQLNWGFYYGILIIKHVFDTRTHNFKQILLVIYVIIIWF